MIKLITNGAERKFSNLMRHHMLKKIQQVSKKGYFKVDKIAYNITPEIMKIINMISINIDIFLLAKPAEQRKLIQLFQSKYPCAINNGLYSKKEDRTSTYAFLYYLFVVRGYNEFSKGISFTRNGEEYIYSAYDMIGALDCKTCPYCNRNYISIITREKVINEDGSSIKQKKTRTELDHFFPSSVFPFLAINFFNLIPSCKTCNHLKSDQNSYDDKLKNPHEISNTDFKFDYSIKYIFAPLEIGKKFSLEASKSLKITFNRKIESNEKYFLLEDIYQQHTDILLELIVKRMYYSPLYIKHLKDNFGFTNDEIYRFLLNNYKAEKDFHKRPLSKLISDISKELGFF